MNILRLTGALAATAAAITTAAAQLALALAAR